MAGAWYSVTWDAAEEYKLPSPIKMSFRYVPGPWLPTARFTAITQAAKKMQDAVGSEDEELVNAAMTSLSRTIPFFVKSWDIVTEDGDVIPPVEEFVNGGNIEDAMPLRIIMDLLTKVIGAMAEDDIPLEKETP